MDSRNVVERLLSVYHEHGKILVAFDFDDTIYNTHNRQSSNYNMILELLQELKPYAKFMCFSCSETDRFPFIEQFCKNNNLRLDVGVNENLIDLEWSTRKPYYNIILDDRCGLRQTYEDLCTFLLHVSGENINRLINPRR